MFPITMECSQCKKPITVHAYSKYVTCPHCGKTLPFEGKVYNNEEWESFKKHFYEEFGLAQITYTSWIEHLRFITVYADIAYFGISAFTDKRLVSYLNARYAVLFAAAISVDLGAELEAIIIPVTNISEK